MPKLPSLGPEGTECDLCWYILSSCNIFEVPATRGPACLYVKGICEEKKISLITKNLLGCKAFLNQKQTNEIVKSVNSPHEHPF